MAGREPLSLVDKRYRACRVALLAAVAELDRLDACIGDCDVEDCWTHALPNNARQMVEEAAAFLLERGPDEATLDAMVGLVTEQQDHRRLAVAEAALAHLLTFVTSELDSDPGPWAGYFVDPEQQALVARLVAPDDGRDER